MSMTSIKLKITNKAFRFSFDVLRSCLLSLRNQQPQETVAADPIVMEPPLPPTATTLSEYKNSNKRGFPVDMDSDDVVEVAPPPQFINRKLRNKNKEVILQDVIEIDEDEDSAAAMCIDDKVDIIIKGKAVENFSNDYHFHQSKEVFVNGRGTSRSVNAVETAMGVASASNHLIDLDGLNSYASSDDDFADPYVDDFDYAFLQSHFDNSDIPPGIEMPIPHMSWLSDSPKPNSNGSTVSGNGSVDSKCQTQSGYVGLQGNSPSLSPWIDPLSFNMMPIPVSTSSLKTQMESIGHHPGGGISSSWKLSNASRSKKKQSALHTEGLVPNLEVGEEPSKSQRLLGALQRKKKLSSSSSSTVNKFTAVFAGGYETSSFGHSVPYNANLQASEPFGVQSPLWSDPIFSSYLKPNIPSPYSPITPIYPPGLQVNPWFEGVPQTQHDAAAVGLSTTPARQFSSKEIDESMQKFRGFKQFDTVEDPSDHHYNLAGTLNGNSMMQPSKNWAKRIQDEWKSLEKDLPDTVFVRVYEARMDLLRAVIVGAGGTPYHDGLFFFDVSFPNGYPNVPPHVYYHSGGLRLNPNLYNCGKVCLSLLNTWSGNSKERWIPGVSTILQVLVSIQGLILNTKPYFNEPGYASMNGSEAGETRSHQYNESTFILSLTTMVYMMRRPPKHFEDFVVGHFRERAHDILVACKAYMDGAQVGCLVKGGVQDVDEGDKSCSQQFKDSLARHIPMLVKEFTQIGVKDCEKYLSPTINGNNHIASMPQPATSMVSC